MASTTSESASPKIPVSVLTGFLGAGKTTLLNYILTQNHGKKIAVIENEFGSVGIDDTLISNAIVSSDEEIFVMNNGCMCCTVRGDLIRILQNLAKRRNKFDLVLIETTGLADPGPIVQTFYMDEVISTQYRLDAIITVVDLKHVMIHLDEKRKEGQVNEAVEQIAFADKIVLNKRDLVSDEETENVKERIHNINAFCKTVETTQSRINLDDILDIHAFDLERILKQVPELLKESEEEEEHHHHHHEHEHEHHDHEHKHKEHKHKDKEHKHKEHKEGEEKKHKKTKHNHDDASASSSAAPAAPAAGDAPAAPHDADHCHDDACEQHHHHKKPHKHRHDDEVSSIAIQTDLALDFEKTQSYLRTLLAARGADIYRMKGILNFKNKPNRFVFQGVHMLLDCEPSHAWAEGEARSTKLVFIGKKLEKKQLEDEFLACAAPSE